MTDLTEHERRLWIETGEAYRELAHEDAVMIMPIENGIMARGTAIERLSETPYWDEVEFKGVSYTEVVEDVIHMSYEAKAKNPDREFRALCSSVWITGGGAPRIIHHQQTPLPAAAD